MAHKSLRVLKLLWIFIDRVVYRCYSDNVLFRFFIDRIFFRVLNDRVLYESSVAESSSGSAVIDSSIILDHQSSFSAMPLFFYQIALLFFIKKTDALFHIHYILKNSLTCFNNFNKTGREKMNK